MLDHDGEVYMRNNIIDREAASSCAIRKTFQVTTESNTRQAGSIAQMALPLCSATPRQARRLWNTGLMAKRTGAEVADSRSRTILVHETAVFVLLAKKFYLTQFEGWRNHQLLISEKFSFFQYVCE
jgi:hypothetical protein